MKSIFAFALAAGLSAAPVFAANAHMDREAAEVLRNYNIDVPVSELSEGQKGQIVMLAHMDGNSGVRTQIISVLGKGLLGRFLRN